MYSLNIKDENMRKRKKLTADDLFKKPHYLLIICTIHWGQGWDKKIRLLHLRYVFVENHGIILERNDKPTKIKKQLEEFLTDPEGNSLIEALEKYGWLQNKISSTNNLTNFLHKLKKLELIKAVKDKEDIYPHYILTSQGMYITTKWLLNWYINEFCPDEKIVELSKIVFDFIGVKP